jgi:outer membrane biosynthesis protein TonB
LADYRRKPFSGLDGLTLLIFLLVAVVELTMIYIGSQIPVPELTQAQVQEIFATRYKSMLKIEIPKADEAPASQTVTAPVEETAAGEEEAAAPEEERAREVLDKPTERQQGSAQASAERRDAAADRRASRRAAISQQVINSTGGLSLVTGGRGAAAARGLVDAAQVTGGGAISTQGLVGMVTGKAAENVKRLKTSGAGGAGTGSGGVNLQGALTDVDTRAGGGGTVGALLEGAVQTYDRSGKFAGESARSASALRSAISNYSAGLKDCYERQLQRDKTLKGSVLAKFTIKADGSVADVEMTQSNWSDPNAGRRVESCLKQKISSWRFDPIDPKLGDFKMGQKMAFGS